MKQTRIDKKFEALKAENRPALVTFFTAGDPDLATSLEILKGLPQAGADVIELGMPFSDPMAEGPPIQASSKRALEAGHTMAKTLDMVRAFRETDQTTPIVLMGYYNPIYIYGPERFVKVAHEAGVDGLIIVDVPAESDNELCLPALDAGINFIRLATPTTDEKRLPRILENTSGFLYYVSITGITGSASADPASVAHALNRFRKSTDLPISVGFGVKTPQHAEEIGKIADGVVVGSAIVNAIKDSLDENGQATAATTPAVFALVRELAGGCQRARLETV